MLTNQEIGNRIKTLREGQGLTLKEIADKINVAASTIQRYESGSIVKLKQPVIDAIAKALGVNSAWLTGESSVKERPDINLDGVYLSLAKEAQENAIDPEDIRLAIDTIKRLRNQ